MKTVNTLIEKGTLMAKPRHHTLQGICQDVCVNYQQVVEVHRRIREVVLSDGGKVITHNLGTFFCRDVRPRVGVLNGRPWSTEGFFEVGLSGERTERGDAHNDPRGERISFTTTSGVLFDSVLSDLFGPFGYTELDFTQGLPVLGRLRNPNDPPLPIDTGIDPLITSVAVNDLENGFHDVVFEVLESDNIDNRRIETLASVESLLVVNGEHLALGGSTTVNTLVPVTVSVSPAILSSPTRPNEFRYRISYTFVDNANE